MRIGLFPAIVAGATAIALAVRERDRLGLRDLRPAVVAFHGGAWANGSKDEMRDRVRRRYPRKGFVVANVEYRRGAITAAAEDAIAALIFRFLSGLLADSHL
jgi:acetyl esterase/lipase